MLEAYQTGAQPQGRPPMKAHFNPVKLGRLAAVALAAAGIAAGAGVAAASTNSLATPHVSSVTATSPSTIAVTWEDREAHETHYELTLYGMSAEGYADGLIRVVKAPAVPGQGGTGHFTL